MVDVSDPNYKGVKMKKVVPIGGRKVLDILKNTVLRSPENFILSKIKSYEPWIFQAEEAFEKLRKEARRLSRQVTGGKSFGSGKQEEGAAASLLKASSRLNLSNPSNEEITEESGSDYSDDRKAKIHNLLSQKPEIRKFFEARFDPNEFKIEVPSQMMKSLIMETARFLASREERDIDKALLIARDTVELGEGFLNKFSKDEDEELN
jgi:hypothetical protein